MAGVSRVRSGSTVLGFQSLSTNFVTSATHTTFQDEGLSISVSYQANRRLRVTWQGGLFAGGGAQRIQLQLLRTSTVLSTFVSPTTVNSLVTETYGFSTVFNGPATAATETFKLQIAAYTSNTSVQSSGSNSPRTLLIEDLGPQ
jgi:hypothetical protein